MTGKPSWANSSAEFYLEQKDKSIASLKRDLKIAILLLKNTTCDVCDGSGAIPNGAPYDPDWEQCQWCDESKWLIENYKDML